MLLGGGSIPVKPPRREEIRPGEGVASFDVESSSNSSSICEIDGRLRICGAGAATMSALLGRRIVDGTILYFVLIICT